MKGRAFRGGSDEKMRRMWFGRENEENVGLTPLPEQFETWFNIPKIQKN